MLKSVFVIAVTANLLLIKTSLAYDKNYDVAADDAAYANADNNYYAPKYQWKCGKNEVKSDCIEGGCSPKTCTDLDRNIPCVKIDPKYCTKGCLCKEGYLRAQNGTCIPISKCTFACTRKNEIFQRCSESCPPQTCESLGKKYFCPRILVVTDGSNCRPSCRCKPNYYRNNNGECIPKDKCPAVCGKNEVNSDCIEGGCQAKTCSDLDRNIPCKKIDPKYCTKGCLCKDGYLRADNGTCIPISDCTLTCSRPHEKFEQCPKICPPQTCDSLGHSYSCPAIIVPTNISNCRPACRCEENYFRNSIGECISKDDCLKCTGPNEYFSCGGACDNVCGTLSEQNQTNCPIVNIVCNKMCYCQEGYARAENNTCIPIENCKDPQCPLNETYKECPSSTCEPRECSQLGFPLNCSYGQETNCEDGPACVCNDLYVRNDEGLCVPRNECPSCGGDVNAESGCGVNCGRHCSNYFNKGSVACPAICVLNGCQCKPGKYYDDVTKKCVDPENCNPTCGKNEVVSNCVNGGCGKQNCSQINEPILCIDPISCRKGCVCEKGYLRHPNGTCVPEIQCPTKCGKNEIYKKCIEDDCKALYCSELGYPLECAEIEYDFCTEGCVCKNGFLRSDYGICIPTELCPSCGGDPNAKSGCGVYCNKRCENIGGEPVSCIEGCYENACDCKDGFYLDYSTGKCVRPDQCSSTCDDNEVPVECIENYCKPEYCSQYGFPLECSNSSCCTEGYVCEEGYLRADNGNCIPMNFCPSCGGDPNAQPGCGINCNRHCYNIGKEQQSCIAPCYNNSCDCKEGYFYDDNTGKCVTPEDCSPTCGNNEVYSGCLEARCGVPESCSDLGIPISCAAVVPEHCTQGCVCRKGYVRAENGTCIRKEDCLSCGRDPNAQPGCGINCNKHCSDIGKEQRFCIALCYDSACNCKEGYYYDNDTGKCVKPEDCYKSSICGNDEVYNSCIQALCEPENCSDLGKPIACPAIIPEYCIKGCVCRSGFVRAENGTCIRKEDCPSCGDDPNAVAGCGTNCHRKCSDIGSKGQICDDICAFNGCDCRDGFYYDSNTGKCVLHKECSPICRDDEVFNDCIQGQCLPKECSQLGKPVSCPRIDPRYCIKGCLCKDDHVRAENGTCIPKKRCPSCGGDPNAEAGCGVNCMKKCSDIGKHSSICPRICGINACDCKDGFYYDSNTRKCVYPEDCSPTCGNNEVYHSCLEARCGVPESCSDLGFPMSCAAVVPEHCTQGCVCRKGYVRAENGTCILKEDCPSCGGDPNAQAGCGVNCNKHCDNIGREPKSCKDMCDGNACDCKDGFYLDDSTGKCVRPDQCSKNTTTPDGCPAVNNGKNISTELVEYNKGLIAITGELLYQLHKSKPGESFVSSSFSASNPLSEIALYGCGTTLEQLLKLINLKSKDEIRDIFPVLLKSLQSDESVICKIANKFYGNINCPVSNSFEKDAKCVYSSEAETINFSKAVQAADTINEWVASKTNDLIKNLVSSDMFSSDTRLVSVNALYFLGNWIHQFNPNKTTNRDFYITADKTKSVPTMYQQARINYAEDSNLNAKMIEMNYKGGNFRFVIWLPNAIDGITSMVDKMRDPEIFAKSLNSFEIQTVNIYLPKMDIATSIDLVEILQKANVTDVFDPRIACLEGITTCTERDYISAAVQKARIIVDETGTEAAAATAVVVTGRSMPSVAPETYTFNANHPFVYAVLSKNNVLFCGLFAS